MGKQKNQKKQIRIEAREELKKQPKTKMIFTEDKFYNDLNKPLYLANTEYEIEPQMVDRWLRRGGKIVTNETQVPEAPAQAPVETQEPVAGDDEKKEDGAED